MNRILRVLLVAMVLVTIGILYISCGGSSSTEPRLASAITPVVDTLSNDAVCSDDSFGAWAQVKLPNGAEIEFNSKGKLTFSTSTSPSGPWTDVPGFINLSLADNSNEGVDGPEFTGTPGQTVYYRAHFIPQGVKVNGEQLTSAFGFGSVSFIECEPPIYDPCGSGDFEYDFNAGTKTLTMGYVNNSGGTLTALLSFSSGSRYDIGTILNPDGATQGGNGVQTATFTKVLAPGQGFSVTVTAVSNGNTNGNTNVFNNGHLKLDGIEACSTPNLQ